MTGKNINNLDIISTNTDFLDPHISKSKRKPGVTQMTLHDGAIMALQFREGCHDNQEMSLCKLF